MYIFYLGPIPVLVISKPELASPIFTSSRDRGPFCERMVEVWGETIATSRPCVHFRKRSLLSPLFSPAAISHHLSTFISVADALVHSWREGERETGREREINLCTEFQKLTFDVIGLTGFGYDFEYLDKNREARRGTEGEKRGDRKSMGRREHRENELAQAFQSILQLAEERIFAPFPYWRYVPTRNSRELARNFEIVNSYVDEMILQRLKQREGGEKELNERDSERDGYERGKKRQRDILSELLMKEFPNHSSDLISSPSSSDRERLKDIKGAFSHVISRHRIASHRVSPPLSGILPPLLTHLYLILLVFTLHLVSTLNSLTYR